MRTGSIEVQARTDGSLCVAAIVAAMLFPQALIAAGPVPDFSAPEPHEALSAGAATSRKSPNRDAFSHPSANMAFGRRLDFTVGNGVFRKLWVSAPSSTTSSDGLGPLYNARACQRCHLKDGRGRPPTANWPEEEAVSLFLRLSVPPRDDADRRALAAYLITVVPEPTYGGQLQNLAIPGQVAEGKMHVDYSEETVVMSGGETASLRRPRYSVTNLGYGPMRPDTMMSPRVAPPMIGLGLLEAVSEADILSRADPEDRDGDGISGRPNWSYDAQARAVRLGRFGWKAGQPSIRQQNAHAFAGDIGISNPTVPDASGDCTAAEAACRAAPHGARPGDHEVGEILLDKVAFYARNLAVPMRRGVDRPDVLAGKALFHAAGCVACHRPTSMTRGEGVAPEQAGQLIWPYTDMLLHDMGEGLADDRPEGAADGREWRTPPLWGIGLTETVSGHTFFLHDGRARSVLEAILWHDGEARAARDRVMAMTPDDRTKLIAFLESL